VSCTSSDTSANFDSLTVLLILYPEDRISGQNLLASFATSFTNVILGRQESFASASVTLKGFR